jgi:hypothetical protein
MLRCRKNTDYTAFSQAPKWRRSLDITVRAAIDLVQFIFSRLMSLHRWLPPGEQAYFDVKGKSIGKVIYATVHQADCYDKHDEQVESDLL